MIPLVAYEQELELMRELVDRMVEEEDGGELDVSVGTMIELPRACFVADKIAEHADFFSFGTNDLTQTSLGFSRDDVESGFLNRYLERKILDRSPFETIDDLGVGWLVRLAAWVGREAKPDLKLGICGEHGGDPDSIAFFHMAGLDYVSALAVPRSDRASSCRTGRDNRIACRACGRCCSRWSWWGSRCLSPRARRRTSSAPPTGPTRRPTRRSSRPPAARCRRRAACSRRSSASRPAPRAWSAGRAR